MAEEFFMFTPEVAAEMEVTLEAFTEVVRRVLNEEARLRGVFGIMHPDTFFRCDICGLAVPVNENTRVSVLAYNKCSFDTDIYQPRLNVCSKCLPKLMDMLNRAIIKTSELMVAENGGVLK